MSSAPYVVQVFRNTRKMNLGLIGGGYLKIACVLNIGFTSTVLKHSKHYYHSLCILYVVYLNSNDSTLVSYFVPYVCIIYVVYRALRNVCYQKKTSIFQNCPTVFKLPQLPIPSTFSAHARSPFPICIQFTNSC